MTETISSQHLSDEENIRRILAGEKELYENIMRKYNQRLYRISMSIINDSEEAQDILQSSYIKAYEHLGGFQFKSNFSTWLIKILINESLLRLRQKKHLKQLSGQELKLSSDKESPLQKVMSKEVINILEKTLTELPEKYRLVFIMREVENMSTSETMECLNISESNVKIRLSRAKEMLRDSLTNYYKSEDIYDFDLSRCDTVVRNVLVHIKGIK